MPSVANNYESLSKEDLVRLLVERDQDTETNPHRKKYGLIWEDKPEQFEADSIGRIPVLKRDPEKCIQADSAKPTHVLIQGDNYHALKVLTYTHERSVDVIYIDPPYNTGNKDFKYNDKFVDRDDAYRHSKWLSFMAKRLRLAKCLLQDSGLLFVSIDDNEVAQLKLLCNEVFGEKNFVANVVLKKGRGSQDSEGIKTVHEYALVYAKNKAVAAFAKNIRTRDKNTAVTLRKTGENDRRQDGPNQYYPIYVDPHSGTISTTRFPGAEEVLPVRPDGSDGCWRWSAQKVERDKALLHITHRRAGGYDLKTKYEVGTETAEPFNALLLEHGAPGGTELNDIVPGNGFKNPKHTSFIRHLISMHSNPRVILDFFAGSGTTAHAVMQLNAEDAAARQCILVTNDEGEFKDELGAPRIGGICTNVTWPRLQAVIGGYTNQKGSQVSGLGENLAFFRTEFVEDRAVERYRRELSARSVEMLCLRESCFSEEKTGDKRWRSFTDNQGRRLVVVVDQYATDELRLDLTSDKRATVLYAFRFDEDDNPAREYGGKGLEHVTAKPIPDSILALHRRLAKQQ